MLKNYKNKVRGFTLLELVIVIAVIGILAVIVLPSMLSALAKARDSKRMSEIRGVQTFLQVSGIDSSLRYPKNATELLAWYVATGNRPPVELAASDAAPMGSKQYKYTGINCKLEYQPFKIGTLSVFGTDGAAADRRETCSSYHLWVELEQRAVALSLDADLVEHFTRDGTGVFTAVAYDCGTSNGPCVKALPGVAVPQLGDKENCAVSSATAPLDCVFDLVP